MDPQLEISITELIKQADIVVKFVMLSLVVTSIYSWTIIFDKLFKFFIIKTKSSKFEHLLESKNPLEQIFKIVKKKNNHPFAKILTAITREWEINDIKTMVQFRDNNAKITLKERLACSVDIASSKSMERIESKIYLLAIMGSISPFIGLFGTVWGIMNSFKNIAYSNSTNLAVVAPGIAEALLATAMGLFVAIPAILFYNIFTNKINIFYEKMRNFSNSISNILSRELDDIKTK